MSSKAAKRIVATAVLCDDSGNGMEEMKAKKAKFMNEMDGPCSLSKRKVVYRRAKILGDGQDDIVVRQLTGNENEKPKWSVFGAKGRKTIENIYFGLVGVLESNKTEIMLGSKYGVEEMRKLLALLSPTDRESARRAVEENMRGLTLSVDATVNILFSPKSPCQVALATLYSDPEDGGKPVTKTSIYLFTSEIVKLIRHLRREYGVGDSEFDEMNNNIRQMVYYENDDFF